MSFHTENILAGYARAAVAVRRSPGRGAAVSRIGRATKAAWVRGERFVLAPAMTAIVAAERPALRWQPHRRNDPPQPLAQRDRAGVSGPFGEVDRRQQGEGAGIWA
ncbi:hypothetical protein ACN27G_29620 [Plantactinospora sp. WMMB334]|uniref:hypothetical protein n=1 Tax=Plantactinospora sp. WMMB334 TaxID=3404119 RepID=UPI003B966AF8